MPFDTSNVAATVGQGQQNNPIDTIQKFAFIQNLMNQNRLFQGQTQAGQAFQGALNADGTVNPTALGANLEGIDPRFAAAVPAAAQQGATLFGTNIANATGQQQLGAARIQALRNTIGSIPPGSNQQANAETALAMGVRNGLWTQDDAATYAGNGMPDLIKEAAVQSGSESAQAAQFGQPQVIPTNAAQVPTAINRVTGTVEPIGAPIPMGLAPQVANTPAYTRYNPVTRQTETITQAQAAASPPGGPIGATPPLGTPEAVATASAANTQQAMAMQSAANEVPTRKALLSNLQGLAPQFAAGPQSPFWKGIGSVAAEYGIPVPNANLATNATAAQEEFDKLSVSVLGSQRLAAGLPQTDASTALASGATPNERMTPKGIQRVLGVMQGNEDYIAAQNSAYQKWLSAGNTGETFGAFKNQFNRMFDPRVFQAQYATPDEKAAIMKSVGPKTFETQWTALHRLGWLGSPSGQ